MVKRKRLVALMIDRDAINKLKIYKKEQKLTNYGDAIRRLLGIIEIENELAEEVLEGKDESNTNSELDKYPNFPPN